MAPANSVRIEWQRPCLGPAREISTGSGIQLVYRLALIDGYSRFSFGTRAWAVVNCSPALACFLFD